MGASVVDRRDFHVLVPGASLVVLALDAHVREVNLLVEVGEVVLDRPQSDLLGTPVGASITVGTVSIPLLKEALVLPLELVVEDDAPEAIAAFGEAVGSLEVGSVDLGVVLQFPRLPDTRVERLRGVLARPPARLQQLTSVLRQGDDTVSVSRQRYGLHEPALTEMAEV